MQDLPAYMNGWSSRELGRFMSHQYEEGQKALTIAFQMQLQRGMAQMQERQEREVIYGMIAEDMRTGDCRPEVNRMLEPLREYCYQQATCTSDTCRREAETKMHSAYSTMQPMPTEAYIHKVPKQERAAYAEVRQQESQRVQAQWGPDALEKRYTSDAIAVLVKQATYDPSKRYDKESCLEMQEANRKLKELTQIQTFRENRQKKILEKMAALEKVATYDPSKRYDRESCIEMQEANKKLEELRQEQNACIQSGGATKIPIKGGDGGKLLPGMSDVPDAQFKVNVVHQKKHNTPFVPCYLNTDPDLGITTTPVIIPNGAPIFSAYTNKLVGYAPISHGIKCDESYGNPNFEKDFHGIAYNLEKNRYSIH